MKGTYEEMNTDQTTSCTAIHEKAGANRCGVVLRNETTSDSYCAEGGGKRLRLFARSRLSATVTVDHWCDGAAGFTYSMLKWKTNPQWQVGYCR